MVHVLIRPSTSGYKAMAASTEGNRVTIEKHLPGESPWASHSSACLCLLVEFTDELGGSHKFELNFSFRANKEDELSITASEGGFMASEADGSPGLPPSDAVAQSEADTKLAVMLTTL